MMKKAEFNCKDKEMKRSLELRISHKFMLDFSFSRKNRDGNWLYLIIRDIPVVRASSSSAHDRVEYLESF